MQKIRKIVSAAVALSAAAAVFTPGEALARKKGVLEGEPIVRKKLQLRKLRFQITPTVGMSLSQPFVHEGYAGARIGFHATEWLGVRAGFLYGVLNLKSKLHKDLVDNGGLPAGIAPGQVDNSVTNGPMCDSAAPCRPLAENDNPAPLLHDFQAGLTHAQWQTSVDVVFTPFVGKLGLFSAIFTEYDVYIFGGLGIMGWSKFYNGKGNRGGNSAYDPSSNSVGSLGGEAQSTAQLEGLDTNPRAGGNPNPAYCRSATTMAQNDECILHPVKADERIHLGASFGGGIHLFITDWAAIDLEIQDIVTSNNLTGLNATIDDVVEEGGPVVNRKDQDLFHNVTLQVGAKFYIPFRAKRSK